MQSLLPSDPYRKSRDRTTFFIMLVLAFLMVEMWMRPQKPANIDNPVAQEKQEQPKPVPPKNAENTEQTNTPAAETKAEPQWLTLGSMNPDSPYRMLVTLTNQGAAVSRIELNTPHYRDVQEVSGYLGQIVADQTLCDKTGDGVIVQVAGHGTPAEKFDLRAGDKITQITFRNRNTGKEESVNVKKFDDLRHSLLATKPGDSVKLDIIRGNHKIEALQVQLGQYPMDVIRPESAPKDYEEYRLMGGLRGFTDKTDQLSFLTTLQRIDGFELDLPVNQQIDNSSQHGMIPPDPTLGIELEDVALRSGNWEVINVTKNTASFRKTVPKYHIEIRKTYRLAEREDAAGNADKKHAGKKHGAGFELHLDVAVKNLDAKEHTLAYQLDGPTCLPLEGGWYARKQGPGWGSYGIRDLAVRMPGSPGRIISNNEINIDKLANPWIDITPDYIGADSLFFQCTLKPEKKADEETWHRKIFPIRVGTKNTDWSMLTDISFRLWSKEKTLQPNEEIVHSYSVFAGPKDTAVLAEYGLGETISYGWFWFAAQPLLGVLHFFHHLGLSYAMAIIALTVCVRLLLFPLSIKQAAGAAKMAEIQPELKALAEKYKDDMQARSKAQSALFKKHNYNPLSGCLPIFIQLPIFIGLYKALSIDAGLYGTPLFSPAFRWCSDLSAPDMLFDWSRWWNAAGWTSFNMGQGMLTLGPYFNLLPMLTIALFLIQQAVMMPPPTDEQSRMQRKMMQWMMVFMGLLFFKVPSGLCLYFIVSTVWGLLERRFIPKHKPLVSETVYDIAPETKKTAMPLPKRAGKNTPKPESKPEGAFRKWWRELLDKAAEQQKLGNPKKPEKKEKKKKR
ncbi:MAG: YidC/Oxa1 family insertase periplasmic-domain containing protein [Planctomycetaceae bacterium]|jgi:YidC/Oxa1 family membrane protein insertase|nr:YidC/Oxa1 family insertase periplasmic-domain containing protein [Planctomycetaceae bacterium]